MRHLHYSKRDERLTKVLQIRAEQSLLESEEDFSVLAPFILFGVCFLQCLAWIVRHI